MYKELNLFLWWEWLKMVRGLILKGVEPWEDLYWKEVLEEKPGRPEAQRVILRLVPGDVFSEIKSQNVKPWIQARHGSASAVCFVAIQSVRFSFWEIFQNYFTLFTFCKFCFYYTFMSSIFTFCKMTLCGFKVSWTFLPRLPFLQVLFS